MGLSRIAGVLACAALATAAPAPAVTQQPRVLRLAMAAADVPTTTGMPNNGFEGMRSIADLEVAKDKAAARAAYAAAHPRLVDNPPWLFIVHGLDPRAMTRRVRGFASPQSWFVDLTTVDLR